jgi:hypothetical protein
MTIRTTTLATILMTASALAAGPALAQSTGGFTGPADTASYRAAPLTPPAGIAPLPTPRVDAATARDIFGLDPAQLLDSVGTVTMERGGDVFETPASDAQRALIDAHIAGHRGT